MEAGLSIPNDISFISFDDVDMFEIMNMNISTVSRPTETMGKVAAEMLMELINNSEKPTQINEVLLETRLVLRGSEKLVKK
jgi:DNA-binding LacI/PurR family transcriptional regulator